MACKPDPKIYQRKVICFADFFVMQTDPVAPAGISCFLNVAPVVTNRTGSLLSYDPYERALPPYKI